MSEITTATAESPPGWDCKLEPATKAVKTLANTLTFEYENDLKMMNLKLQDLGEKQRRIAEEIKAQEAIFTETDPYKWLDELQIYKNKLIAIKKEMSSINSRTRNLGRKAKDIEKFRTGIVN